MWLVIILFVVGWPHLTQNFILVASTDSISPHIDQGVTLVYDYESRLQLKQGAFESSPESRSRHLSLKSSATLSITHLWRGGNNQTIFKFELQDDFQVSTWYGQKTPSAVPIDGNFKRPFLLVLSDEEAKIYSSFKDVEMLNFQRGLASLFIFRQENGRVDEIDVLGKCSTLYWQDHHGLHKSKERCQSGPQESSRIFSNQKYSNAKWQYKLLDSGIIDSLQVREWLEFYPSLSPELAQDLQQMQSLTLKEQNNEGAKIWSNFKASDVNDAVQQISNLLEIEFDSVKIEGEFIRLKEKKGKKVKATLSTNKKHLRSKSLATKESAQAFIKLLNVVDHASKEDILQILKDKSHQDILPQLIDIIGASSNSNAHQALYDSKYSNPSQTSRIDLFERYMSAVAHSKHHCEDLIENFLNDAQKAKIPHEKIKQTLILTLARLSKKSKSSSTTVLKWIVTNLLRCKENECHQLYLRALKNIQSPSTAAILLKLAESKETDRKTALLALEILSKFDPNVLNVKVRGLDQHLFTLLKDPDRELSLKSVAIELILLTSPSTGNVKEILSLLRSENNKELTAVALQKWTDLAQRNPHLIGQWRLCSSKGWLDWNLLSHGGLSTSFSRFLSQTLAGNSSFTFNLEVSGMLMKRSTFELKFLQENEADNSLIELGMFAGGLSSTVGQPIKDDDKDANAGMILNVLGYQLRPFVFFESMGELMSLYMSGATEQKTPALQGNMVAQRGDLQLLLTNGISTSFWNQGAISFDLSGQATISMWSKVSDSTVENTLAYLLTQSTQLNYINLPPFKQDTTLDTKLGLNLENNIDFSGEKVQTCIKMSQPAVKVSQSTVTKWLSSFKSTSRVNSFVNGKTIFLNEKNNELCNLMYPK